MDSFVYVCVRVLKCDFKFPSGETSFHLYLHQSSFQKLMLLVKERLMFPLLLRILEMFLM